jgi:hypothetical protein
MPITSFETGHRPRQLVNNKSNSGRIDGSNWYAQHLTSLTTSAEAARRNAMEAAMDHQEECGEVPPPLTLGQKLDKLNADALARATNPFAAPARNSHEKGLRAAIVEPIGRDLATDH